MHLLIGRIEIHTKNYVSLCQPDSSQHAFPMYTVNYDCRSRCGAAAAATIECSPGT